VPKMLKDHHNEWIILHKTQIQPCPKAIVPSDASQRTIAAEFS